MRTTARDLVARTIAPDTLGGWYSEGATLADITYRLRTDHDVKVSVETVRRWLKEESEAAA